MFGKDQNILNFHISNPTEIKINFHYAVMKAGGGSSQLAREGQRTKGSIVGCKLVVLNAVRNWI